VCAQRATSAGNLDNRHGEIVCAALAHVNVSVFYQPLTPPSSLGLLASPRAAGNSRPGSAWLGRSQKDGLLSCRAGGDISFAVQGHRLAQEGQPGRCPFLIEDGNGRQDARPCFASRPVIHLHRRRLDLGLRYFGFGLFCARGVAAIGLAENHWR
jgi:hypothetical protein